MTRRTVTRPEVRVGGHWLTTLMPRGGWWGELETGTRLTGDWQASWRIIFPGNWCHPALVFGARVEVYYGPIVVWVGTLAEPDWDAGTFTATGACREAEAALALTPTGVATTAPNTAVDAAISRGVVSWNRVGDFGTTPVGETEGDGGLTTLASVLNAWAQENSSGWRIDRNRSLVTSPTSESTVDWYIVPGSGVLGSADEDRVDRVFVRYISSSTGRLATASYPASTPAGGVERPVDITDRGRMTSTKATSIAQSIWTPLQGRSGWTNGLTLKRGQVTTPGGVPADLSRIRAGHSIRLLGVPDVRGVAQNTDVVIAETEYDWTEDEIQINPVGKAARDDEAAFEKITNLATDANARLSASGGKCYAETAGSVTLSITSAGTGSVSVTFPAGRFTVAPIVTITNGGGTGASVWYLRTSNVTPDGCTISAEHRDAGSTASTTMTVYWHAVQMTSAAAAG